MSRTQRELKALRQAQREEALRKQRDQDRRNLLVIAAGVVLVGIVIFLVAAFLNHQSQPANRLAWHDLSGQTAGTQIPDEGTPSHIDPSTTPQYKFYPPTSGPHYGQPYGPVPWQTVDQTLSEGQFVHNLEHGGVAILYNCPSGSDCDKLKSELTNYVKNLAPLEPTYNEVKLVLTPYSKGMQKKVALVAWHWVEFLDGYDQNEITRFYEIHADQGPEQVP
jgi:hypothetical protein